MSTAIRHRGRHALPGRRDLRAERDALAAECRALAEENAELRERLAELTTGQAPTVTVELDLKPEPPAAVAAPGPDSEDTATLARPTARPADMATGLGATTTHRVMWLGASPLAG